MWKMILQLHKGGSKTTVQNSYTPSPEEREALNIQNEFTKAIMPNAYGLNDSAAKMFFDSIGDTQVDFASQLSQALAQNSTANAGYSNLANGVLPSDYMKNMTDAIRTGVDSTVGSAISNLGSRGVLNSSVTNTALNDISKNVSDTMAQSYQGGIEQLSNIYGNMANNAGNGIVLGSSAQEAAQSPAMAAWNMSLGLGNNSNGTLQALAGKGTSTQTTTQSGGGSSLVSGLLGIGASLLSCFTDDTKIKMEDGSVKRISNISIGDKVICYDKETNEPTVEAVVSVAEPTYQTTYAVVCVGEKNVKKAVYTTLTQPLLTEEGIFIEVGLMRLGTKLKGAGKVTGIVESGERKVYDIKTERTNTYYANDFIAYGMFDKE